VVKSVAHIAECYYSVNSVGSSSTWKHNGTAEMIKVHMRSCTAICPACCGVPRRVAGGPVQKCQIEVLRV
jgi:hypothetical protein